MTTETYSVIDLDSGDYLAGPGLTEEQAASLEQHFRAQGHDAAAVTDSSSRRVGD
jgi:hypothetical protein